MTAEPPAVARISSSTRSSRSTGSVRRVAPASVRASTRRSSINRCRAAISSSRLRRVAAASARAACRSSTSSSVRMRVSGVRSSCDASATNCCWRRTGALQAGQHLVHRHGQAGDLVVAGGFGHPTVEIAEPDRGDLGADPLHRAQRPSDDGPDQRGQNGRRGRDDEQQRGPQLGDALVDVLQCCPDVHHAPAVRCRGHPVRPAADLHRRGWHRRLPRSSPSPDTRASTSTSAEPAITAPSGPTTTTTRSSASNLGTASPASSAAATRAASATALSSRASTSAARWRASSSTLAATSTSGDGERRQSGDPHAHGRPPPGAAVSRHHRPSGSRLP